MTVIREALDRVLDAESINHNQHRVLFNPSAEQDSLAEWIAALPVPAAKRREGLWYVRQLLDLNIAELNAEREAAGLLEPAAAGRQLRDHGLTVKQIAGRLRRPLRQETAFTDAVRAVRNEARQVGVDKLRGPGLANELGPNATQRLHTILDGLQAGGQR